MNLCAAESLQPYSGSQWILLTSKQATIFHMLFKMMLYLADFQIFHIWVFQLNIMGKILPAIDNPSPSMPWAKDDSGDQPDKR